MEILVGILAAALVLGGVAGAVLPVLPGLPMIFGGLLLAAWYDGFQRVGTATIGLMALMLIVGIALDFIAGSFGAKRAGASPKAVLGATLGSIVGMFFGLPGLLLGPFIGAAWNRPPPPASPPGSGCCWARSPSSSSAWR